MYERILAPIEKERRIAKIKTAFVLGINQLIMFSVVACLFWAGAEIIIRYEGEVKSADVFKAMFTLFFSSFSAGRAAATGPDMGRA